MLQEISPLHNGGPPKNNISIEQNPPSSRDKKLWFRVQPLPLQKSNSKSHTPVNHRRSEMWDDPPGSVHNLPPQAAQTPPQLSQQRRAPGCTSYQCTTSRTYQVATAERTDHHGRTDMPKPTPQYQHSRRCTAVDMCPEVQGLETHYQRHAGTLHQPCQQKKGTQDLPAGLPLLLPADQDDEVCDQGHALDDDGKGHQEADRAPHGAERPVVALAVFVLGEGFTGVAEGRAALV